MKDKFVRKLMFEEKRAKTIYNVVWDWYLSDSEISSFGTDVVDKLIEEIYESPNVMDAVLSWYMKTDYLKPGNIDKIQLLVKNLREALEENDKPIDLAEQSNYWKEPVPIPCEIPESEKPRPVPNTEEFRYWLYTFFGYNGKIYTDQFTHWNPYQHLPGRQDILINVYSEVYKRWGLINTKDIQRVIWREIDEDEYQEYWKLRPQIK